MKYYFGAQSSIVALRQEKDRVVNFVRKRDDLTNVPMTRTIEEF